MAARSGGEHHNVRKAREDQAKVLELVVQGIEFDQAVAAVGRSRQTIRAWLADQDFVKKLDEARDTGRIRLEASIGGNKNTVDYATFSKEFLGNEVFSHQQDWIDVLEGREPSWLPEGITFDQGNPNRLLINVPPEHAKSTTITVGYATYLIAMNPNVRIAIVSQTQTRAKEFLYAVKQRLTEPAWMKLQQVYGPPGGWQATADQWTQDRIYLERSSGDPNPTVQALGIGQQIYGARADVIILDDIVTTTNAHEWEKQLNWLQKMVITRLGKNGRLIIVGTRVSAIDLYRELRNPDHWAGGKSPFTYLAMPAVLEFHKDPKKWKTLWPKSNHPWAGDEDEEPGEDGLYQKWDGPALFSRRSEVTPSTWAMVYQQQDIEDDAVFPAHLVNSCVNRARKAGPLKLGAVGHPTGGQWVTFIGIDPAMAGKTAAVAYAVERTSGKRLVLDAHNMAEPTPGKIRALIEDWVATYNPMELRIEINAFQKAFALDEDLRQWLASRGVRFSEHFTGKNKWDTNFGVAGMQGLFGTARESKHNGDNLIELPNPEYHEGIKALINQLITWKADTRNPTDVVMALWFCEIKAKEMIQRNSHRMTHQNNRFLTRRNMSQQTVVSLNELASEQYTVYL
jgi:hypothetical protein